MKIKDLRMFAPADLISIIEYITAKPVELERYRDEDRNPPCAMVKATTFDGSLVLHVRSPKHKFHVEMSPGLMRANPAIVEFLREEGYRTPFAECVRFCELLGAFRRFAVSPRRAEALGELVRSMVRPLDAYQGAIGSIPDATFAQLEFLTGRPLTKVVIADWFVSAESAPALIVSLGSACPSIICSNGELYASTGNGLLDCPLSQWILEGGTTFQRQGESLRATHRYFVRSPAWYSYRRIKPEELETVYQMVGDLTQYQITHAAPRVVQ